MPYQEAPTNSGARQQFDVFNGDADGLCALHQLRLHHPAKSTLVTGIKAHVRLVERITPPPGSLVTVLDLSFKENREGILRLLRDDCRVCYFDHHYPGEIPTHPLLQIHIDQSPHVCTSLLMNTYLEGRYAAWAVTGAFGDNMVAVAHKMASELRLDERAIANLAELGNLLNYNGYGNELADLHFHPVDLYRAMVPFENPLEFYHEAPEARKLLTAFMEDLSRATRQEPVLEEEAGRVYLFPREAWARRVMGVFANRLATERPALATAVGVEDPDGTLRISVRAPLERPHGADALCRQFTNGGGRAGAGAINRLPLQELPRFLEAFRQAFRP